MELSKTLYIIHCLADGIDPATGEVFASDSPYQRPDTVRALSVALQALEQQAIERQAAKASKSWDQEEDERLCAGFSSGLSVEELAQKHGCTDTAIRLRIEHLSQIVLAYREQASREKANREKAGGEQAGERAELFVFRSAGGCGVQADEPQIHKEEPLVSETELNQTELSETEPHPKPAKPGLIPQIEAMLLGHAHKQP